MRKGIESLARIVEVEFGLDPFASATYVFVSRTADKLKMLRWDVNGFWLYYKKLARGTFRWSFRSGSLVLEVDCRQLAWLLDGLSTEQPEAHRPIGQRNLI
jgi:transposase